MKKILFILVLSLYSIQGYASSCPDGSEPVKSISADGTYFVFSCGGGSNEQSSSSNTDSSNTKSNSNQAYQSFPVHEFAKSPLRDLKVPENWKLFKDPSELDLFHERFKGPVHEKHPIGVWNMQPYVDDCERGISEFDQNFRLNEDKLNSSFIRCATVFTHRHFRDRAEGIKTFERILLSWAKTKPVIYAANSNTEMIVSNQAYAASMLMGDFASFYAVYYDDFDFTQEQRQSVEGYLSDWLINHDLTLPGVPICNLKDIKQFEVGGTNTTRAANNCGSNRWRMGIGAVYLGLRTGNQELFTAGNRHIEINLATIDKDGINAVWAGKGAYALSYLRQLPEVLTLLAVAYESIGYDFYEHQLPHGKKIHEVYEALFDFIYHPEKLNKYAHKERYYGGKGNPGVIDIYEFDKLPLSEKWNREFISPEILAAESKGYVIRYRPDLMDKIEYKKTWGHNPNKQAEGKWGEDDHWTEHVSRFVNISGLAIYEAFNQNVSKLIIQDQIELAKKQKKLEQLEVFSVNITSDLAGTLEKKKEKDRIEAEACKTSPLSGEYEARWFRDHWNGNGEWEFVGSEPLILDQCEGEFEGIKQFDPRPTPAVRKKLIVKYQSNGEISIKGGLNLYDIDEIKYTELYGNINDGEISGIWGFDERLKIEFSKKPKPTELFDGRYSFELFRYAEDEADDIGNGIINISNGQIIIDESNRNLQTGDSDLYDTFSGQVDKNGNVSGSVKLDIYSSGQKSEEFFFEGLIDEEIWGESPKEDFFKVYMKLKKQ
jgi:hypothetical protein